MTEPIRSVFIESRTWYDNTGGNSYFSNRIWVNGDIVIETPREYGYDTAYISAALLELYKADLLEEPQGLRQLREKIDVYTCQNSVPKREMFKGLLDWSDLSDRYEAIR